MPGHAGQQRADRIHDLVARRVVAAIEASGKRQSAIARETGISQATISHWVTGNRKPGVGHVALIAGSLGVKVESFYEGLYAAGEATAGPPEGPVPDRSRFMEVVKTCLEFDIPPEVLAKAAEEHLEGERLRGLERENEAMRKLYESIRRERSA